jgi:hypothetical protein
MRMTSSKHMQELWILTKATYNYLVSEIWTLSIPHSFHEIHYQISINPGSNWEIKNTMSTQHKWDYKLKANKWLCSNLGTPEVAAHLG